MRHLFKMDIQDGVGIATNRRPDLVILADNTSLSMTGVEEFGDNGLATVTKVLIIELKRGGFEITNKERNQATDYVDSLITLGINTAKITAFVVGDKITKGVQRQYRAGNNDEGTIFLTNFDQLVDTAEKRMFGLRDKLAAMYDDIPGIALYQQSQSRLF